MAFDSGNDLNSALGAVLHHTILVQLLPALMSVHEPSCSQSSHCPAPAAAGRTHKCRCAVLCSIVGLHYCGCDIRFQVLSKLINTT